MKTTENTSQEQEYIKGRGAQINTQNPFLRQNYVAEEMTGLDLPQELVSATVYHTENAKKILNKVESPDIGLSWSLNPYQGCEHGCIYCYARNTHEYYGFSAGLDFESKIIVKHNAAALLAKQFDHPKWESGVIMLAGNTDCYQPAERKFKITRKILETCLEYGNPVSIITKNGMITRDIDMLQELAARKLVHVNISITTLDESLRLAMEPRTANAQKRLKTMEILSKVGIPVRVMASPMIPFINSTELPSILKAAAEHGALDAGYILVRLNGSIGALFTDWVTKNFPDRAERVLKKIKEAHGGKLSDSRSGTRMKGEGNFAESMLTLYLSSRKKYFNKLSMPSYDYTIFKRPEKGQLSLF